jgi:hypothetical protein
MIMAILLSRQGFQLLFILMMPCMRLFGQEAKLPDRVSVLPVFYVPSDQDLPTADQMATVMRHVRWSQQRYGELLPAGITFSIGENDPRVYRSHRPLAFYEEYPDSSATYIAGALLDAYRLTRYTCPYIFLVVFMNPGYDFPVGGGRPLNGGYNTGGGIIHISSFVLDKIPNVQSTLEHEIGHAIGLPHVDVYGYDMATNVSLMSYNLDHRTEGFRAGKDPAILIPEDRRGLALNTRVLPNLTFEHDRDVPAGYDLSPYVVHLGPMKIAGHPDGVLVSTPSGETFGSSVGNIVQGRIDPSVKTGSVTYRGDRMWTSGKTTTGWVTVLVSFPYSVELTGIRIHSQHSGLYHAVEQARILVKRVDGSYGTIADSPINAIDERIQFDRTKGDVWKLEMRAGPTGYVVIRGLQFYSGIREIFPPLVPVTEDHYR